MFIGRERELAELNRMYTSGRFEFAVIYGRRRVGKTALISRFMQDKKAIYFMGVEGNAAQNRANMSRSIMEVCTGADTGAEFPSFQAALEYVFRCAGEERIVLAIDEYPYIARDDQSFASTLQMLIDKYKDTSQLMLILCGSSMSYMEDEVLSYKSPLYGRRTGQFRLQPFTFEETCRYLSGMADEDKALIYGAVGGTPQYLAQIDPALSVADNIKRTFLNPSAFLYEEPTNLLRQEMRQPGVYSAIVAAIASGSSRMKDICSKVGKESNAISSYIGNLTALGILRREVPYAEPTAHPLYSIEDNMFRFWHRFVPGNVSIIARGAADLAYRRIEPHLSEYMGRVFEDICMQYLWKQLLAGRCPVMFESLGRWWGNDKNTRRQEEIDIVGAQDKNVALFGECKWTNESVDQKVLETLVQRSGIHNHSTKYYYVFAKSGFTTGCRERAAKLGNVQLVTYADILADMQ